MASKPGVWECVAPPTRYFQRPICSAGKGVEVEAMVTMVPPELVAAAAAAAAAVVVAAVVTMLERQAPRYSGGLLDLALKGSHQVNSLSSMRIIILINLSISHSILLSADTIRRYLEVSPSRTRMQQWGVDMNFMAVLVLSTRIVIATHNDDDDEIAASLDYQARSILTGRLHHEIYFCKQYILAADTI